MKNHNNSQYYVMIALISLLVSTLACALNTGGDNLENLDLQQTLAAMQQTQIALENQITERESQISQPDTPLPPEDVIAPTEIATPEPDVFYEGVSFSMDPIIAMGAYYKTVPGQNMGEESMPMETYPSYIEFTFDNYVITSHFHKPHILIFPVEDYIAISPHASNIIDQLKQALITHPSGGYMSNLPFLPMWNAAQIFTAKVEYFDFQNGSGVRYLTMFGQAFFPVDNQNLFYTYQGITTDGRYYIAAIFPVTHISLPNEGQVNDYIEFDENWTTYISETISWLEGQNTDSFSPSLVVLDQIMASFKIDR